MHWSIISWEQVVPVVMTVMPNITRHNYWQLLSRVVIGNTQIKQNEHRNHTQQPKTECLLYSFFLNDINSMVTSSPICPEFQVVTSFVNKSMKEILGEVSNFNSLFYNKLHLWLSNTRQKKHMLCFFLFDFTLQLLHKFSMKFGQKA